MTNREWTAGLFLAAVVIACIIAALIANDTARLRQVQLAVVPAESTPAWNRRIEVQLTDSVRLVKEWLGDTEPRPVAPN